MATTEPTNPYPLGRLTKDVEAFERSLANPNCRIAGVFPPVCIRNLTPSEQKRFFDDLRAAVPRELQAKEQEGDVWS